MILTGIFLVESCDQISAVKFRWKAKNCPLLLFLSCVPELSQYVFCQVFTLLWLCHVQVGGGRRGEMAGAVSPRKQASKVILCLHHQRHRKCPVVSATHAFSKCLSFYLVFCFFSSSVVPSSCYLPLLLIFPSLNRREYNFQPINTSLASSYFLFSFFNSDVVYLC